MNDTQSFSNGAIIGGSAFALVMFLGWATGMLSVSTMDSVRAMWPSGADGSAWGYYAVPAAFIAWVLLSGFVYSQLMAARGKSKPSS